MMARKDVKSEINSKSNRKEDDIFSSLFCLQIPIKLGANQVTLKMVL